MRDEDKVVAEERGVKLMTDEIFHKIIEEKGPGEIIDLFNSLLLKLDVSRFLLKTMVDQLLGPEYEMDVILIGATEAVMEMERDGEGSEQEKEKAPQRST